MKCLIFQNCIKYNPNVCNLKKIHIENKITKRVYYTELLRPYLVQLTFDKSKTSHKFQPVKIG